ncbi:MAG: hypothetical protein BECKG1743D_GA0114223_113182 [Candidatus Kentron sp. G]|nr:MAG: hypothetical protein BECKG1743D_GA0114223_113182 [Candidatus Kentron sp. G]
MFARFLFLFTLFLPTTALAYVGPGIGAGTIASILGLIAAFFLAVFSILKFHRFQPGIN